MTSDHGECWACGQALSETASYALTIRDLKVDESSEPFSVTLCLECEVLIKLLLERVRMARLSQQ